MNLFQLYELNAVKMDSIKTTADRRMFTVTQQNKVRIIFPNIKLMKPFDAHG